VLSGLRTEAFAGEILPAALCIRGGTHVETNGDDASLYATAARLVAAAPLRFRGEDADVLAMLSSLVTSISVGRLGLSSLTPWQRIANALVSYTRYLELSLWPHDLAILYPFRAALPLWQVALATLLLCGITAMAVWQARCRPYLIVGWLWFAVGLLPASGLVQVGRQGMADRFTYLPQIGLVIAVVWGVADLIGKRRPATAAVLSIAIVAGFATASWLHTSV
jgi:hypothetical protein